MRLADPGSAAGTYSPTIHTLRLTDGSDARVEWERTWPPTVRRPMDEDEAPAPPWRVTYRRHGEVFAVEWHMPETDPASMSAFVKMAATIAAYEPPGPVTPPRRGLLFHLFDAVQRWYGHGT